MYREENIITQGANSDDDDRSLPRGQYRELWYCRLGSVDGNAFFIKTSAGTEQVTNPSLINGDVVVGCKEWYERRKVIYMVWKPSLIHEIWSYDVDAETHTLLNADPIWNFQRGNKLNHIVIGLNALCSWVDGYWTEPPYSPAGVMQYNEPFLVDLDRLAAGDYPSPLSLQDVQFIKWPFEEGPICVYDTDLNVAGNSLSNKTFRFRATPIYWNNEEAAYSAYSALVMPNLSEYVSGNDWGASQTDNVIKITVNTGSYVIRKINVAASINGANFGVVVQIDKDVLGLADNVPYTFNYYGNAVQVPLPTAIRNQDEVPYSSDCEALLPSREIAFVSYRVGRDKIELDTTIQPIYNEKTWTPDFNRLQVRRATTETVTDPDNLIFKWNDEVGFSIIDGDTYTIQVSYGGAVPNSFLLTYTVTQALIDQALLLPTVPEQLQFILETMVQSWVDYINEITGLTFLLIDGDTLTPSGLYANSWVIQTPTNTWNDVVVVNPNALYPQRRTLAELDHIKGTTYQYGLQYYDAQGRAFTVYTDESLEMQVPFYTEQSAIDYRATNFVDPDNAYTIDAKITINHLPHPEAAYYRLVRREINGITNLQEVTVVDISPAEQNQWGLTIDKQYSQVFAGAGVNHQPSKGDIVRFIRKKLNDVPNATADDNPYNTNYFEVEVGRYDVANKIIYVDRFDPSLIEYTGYVDRGYVIQVYTPAPSIDTEGNLFVSAWKELSPRYLIGNAHTNNAIHYGNIGYRGSVTDLGDILDDSFITTDLDFLSTDFISRIVLTNQDGETQEIETVSVTDSAGSYLVTLNGELQFDFTAANGGTFELYLDQQLVSNLPFRAATLSEIKGDVWFRQRFYETGYSGTLSNRMLYYFVNDFWYSDYWVQSRINDNGRLAIESPYEKRTYKYASAIHGGKFFDNTLVNDICRFEYIIQGKSVINVKDMDDQWGKVVKAIVDGKTLKCIQEKKENSIYINFSGYVINTDAGEQLTPPQGNTFGQWKPYESNFGSMDAGSVVLVPNKGVSYFDRLSGCFILSTNNGQEEISNYIQLDGLGSQNYKYKKRANEITDLCRQYPTDTVTYVDELNGEIAFGFIHHVTADSYFFAIAPNTMLPLVLVQTDVTATIIGQTLTLYDGEGNAYEVVILTAEFNSETGFTNCTFETALGVDATGYYFTEGEKIYSLDTFDYLRLQWRTRYDYNFQRFCNLGNRLFGFRSNAQLDKHNINNSITFHGQTVTERIKVVFNDNSNLMKRFLRIILKSTSRWSVPSMITRNNLTYGTQETNLVQSEFTTLAEGVLAAQIKRDINSPNFATQELARVEGNVMRGQSLSVNLEREVDGSTITFSTQIMGETSPVKT